MGVSVICREVVLPHPSPPLLAGEGAVRGKLGLQIHADSHVDKAKSQHLPEASDRTVEERETTKPPYNSGYPEQRPEPAKKQQKAPDSKSPHEPQNVPQKKPYPSSG
jgi:hypothetical protein